jgi:dTDP-4-amino-4,6-dideoxygalactose transaminase
MQLKLADPAQEYALMKTAMDEAVLSVLQSGQYVLDENVRRLEETFAKFCGVTYGVGTASGTMALVVGLRAAGIGAGDEVITAPYTSKCTTAAISLANATIRFADIDEETFTLDPKKIAGAITERTRAIMPVHLHGQVADMDAICEIAREHNLFVIEDAALAVGAEYRQRRVGSFGQFAVFSFAPTKILGGIGWGGILVTNDDEIAVRARQISGFGYRPGIGETELDLEGYNVMISSIQAAALNVKMPYLTTWLARRREIAARYDEACDALGITRLHPPAHTNPSWRTYVIRLPQRDEMLNCLQQRGIEAGTHFTPVLHMRPLYRYLGYKQGDFPVAEKVTSDLVCLPIHPHLSDVEVTYIIDALAEITQQEEAAS